MPRKPKRRILKSASKKSKNRVNEEKKDNFLEIIKNHRLVPEAKVLNEKEVEELLNKFKIKKENLPKIFVSDPLVKITGAKVGDVLEIKRKDPIAGETIYYRLVIE